MIADAPLTDEERAYMARLAALPDLTPPPPRWWAAHPDVMRENRRSYYERHRDAINSERRRRWAERKSE